jgi:predicted phage terminase large subunit-like protein
MSKKDTLLVDAQRIQKSHLVRRAIAEKSFEFFFELYFEHYMTAPFGEFHKEIFRYLEDERENFITIMAFRGSGKSSIISTAFPIWSILGTMKNKFIVIVAQTQAQAKLYMRNLKEELESNMLLKWDLWPFEEDSTEWNNTSLVLKKFWARITVISVDQSTRGIRHKNHRPDLIIADDIENIQSMKTREGRDNLQEWFTKELIPIWDPKKTKIVLLGNMLHRDSLLMRIKEGIDKKTRLWVFLRYPLLDENGLCIWTERFSAADLEHLRMTIGSDISWKTEYLLQEAWRDGQIVNPEWIHWAQKVPEKRWDYDGVNKVRTGVDLAISEETWADYTAFVTGVQVGYDTQRRIYIVDALEKKMNFPTTVEALKVYDIVQKQRFHLSRHEVLVETVGYQEALHQHLKTNSDIHIEGYKPNVSKTERLTLVTDLIKNGMVIFVNNPAVERLVEQILGFQQETHDDLVDAFTMMVLKFMSERGNCKVVRINIF